MLLLFCFVFIDVDVEVLARGTSGFSGKCSVILVEGGCGTVPVAGAFQFVVTLKYRN